MQIQMTIEEYNDLQTRLKKAEDDNAELRKDIETFRTADPSGEVPRLVEAVQAALPIVRFAVGNWDPRTIKGWPYAALTTFANALETVPGIEFGDRESAIEMRNFAKEAKELEDWRLLRDAAILRGEAPPAPPVVAAVAVQKEIDHDAQVAAIAASNAASNGNGTNGHAPRRGKGGRKPGRKPRAGKTRRAR